MRKETGTKWILHVTKMIWLRLGIGVRTEVIMAHPSLFTWRLVRETLLNAAENISGNDTRLQSVERLRYWRVLVAP